MTLDDRIQKAFENACRPWWQRRSIWVVSTLLLVGLGAVWGGLRYGQWQLKRCQALYGETATVHRSRYANECVTDSGEIKGVD